MCQFFKKVTRAVTTAALSAGLGTAIVATAMSENEKSETKAAVAMFFSMCINPVVNYFVDYWSRANPVLGLKLCLSMLTSFSAYSVINYGGENPSKYPVVSAAIASTAASLGWEVGDSITQCRTERLEQQRHERPIP